MRKIQLTQDKIALVDNSDYQFLSKYKWRAIRNKKSRTYYAMANIYEDGKRTTILMHRKILNVKKGIICDHINGNGLDNRRLNLRVCSFAENVRNSRKPINNTSGYKGVSWDKRRKIWQSYITYKDKTIHLGAFRDIGVAAFEYNKAAIKYHKKFANLNFI